MSFMTRVRIAIVEWWIRTQLRAAREVDARDRAGGFQEDLEGMGRRLARPPLRNPDPTEVRPLEEEGLPATVREARLPRRLVIRWDV